MWDEEKRHKNSWRYFVISDHENLSKYFAIICSYVKEEMHLLNTSTLVSRWLFQELTGWLNQVPKVKDARA